jgi:hypothetical protein
MIRFIALVSAGLAIATCGSGPAAAAFAIAFNPATGKAAAYNGSFDLEQAKRVALGNCGGGCRIVASGKATCAAVVESVSTGISAWAGGRLWHHHIGRREPRLARLPAKRRRHLQNRRCDLRLKPATLVRLPRPTTRPRASALPPPCQ